MNDCLSISIASLVELSLGQPLDRIKMNNQTIKGKKLTINQLYKKGYGEFYKGIKPTIIHSCFLYYPIMSYLDNYWSKNYENKSSKFNNVKKSTFISFFITPSIMCFENIKKN